MQTQIQNQNQKSTINGTLLAKQYLQINFSNCTKFLPTSEMIKEVKNPSNSHKDIEENLNVTDLMGREE